MTAPGKITVTLSAAGITARLSVPLDVLTAALFETGDRLAGADDTEAGELALVTLAGIGGIDLTQISEAVTIAAWADQLEASDLTRWDACAERAAVIFGAAAPEADTAGVAS